MFLGAILWFVAGPWYADTVIHQSLRDPINMVIWAAIGMGMFFDGAAHEIAQAIRTAKK